MLDCKIAVGRELNGCYHCVPVSLGSAVIGAPLSCPLSVTLSRLLPPPALTDGFNTTNMVCPVPILSIHLQEVTRRLAVKPQRIHPCLQ